MIREHMLVMIISVDPAADHMDHMDQQQQQQRDQREAVII
jgi:hypothetical protein